MILMIDGHACVLGVRLSSVQHLNRMEVETVTSAAKEHDITIHVAIYQRRSYHYCTANSFLLLKRHHQIKKNMMTIAHAI